MGQKLIDALQRIWCENVPSSWMPSRKQIEVWAARDFTGREMAQAFRITGRWASLKGQIQDREGMSEALAYTTGVLKNLKASGPDAMMERVPERVIEERHQAADAQLDPENEEMLLGDAT